MHNILGLFADTPTLHRQDWKSKVELGQLSVIKEVSTVGVNPSTKNDSPEGVCKYI